MEDKGCLLRNFRSKGGSYREQQGWSPNCRDRDARLWSVAPSPVSGVWQAAADPERRPFFEQMLRESSCRAKHRPPHLPKELDKPTAREHSGSWSLERLLRRLRAMEANQDDKLARVLRALGEFGAFQRRLVVLILVPNVLLAFLTFADFFVFTAQRPYCNTSWILAVGPNLTEAEQMNLTLPRGPDGSFQTCLMYLPVAWDLDSIIRFGLNYTKSCQDGWIYPDTKKRSLINEVWLVLSCLQLPRRPRDVPLTEQVGTRGSGRGTR